MYFQQIVVVARDVVALGDLGNSAHDARKFGGDVAVEAPELYAAKDDEAAVELLGVEHGDVFADIAFVVEPLEPFEYGRGREMHTCGELLGRQAGVLLQDAQDLQIGLVVSVHGIKFFPGPFFGGRSAVIFCVRV